MNKKVTTKEVVVTFNGQEKDIKATAQALQISIPSVYRHLTIHKVQNEKRNKARRKKAHGNNSRNDSHKRSEQTAPNADILSTS